MSAQPAKQIRGVIFDLDGTLYRLSWLKLRMTLALWTSRGVLRRLTAARSSLRGREFGSAAEYRDALFQELGGRSGISAEQAAHWYDNQFMAAFVEILAKHCKARPGIAPLLASLKKNGVKLAVFSDFGRVADRLAALGLRPDDFDDLVSAGDFGAPKPSPRPLRMLAQKWQMRPDELLVVGDREDLDATGAEAAGMPFLGVTDRALWLGGRRGFLSWSKIVRLLVAQSCAYSSCSRAIAGRSNDV